ncbi:MAG: reverse transcriptase family protein [Verrucomicrobiota bacterium]
MPASASLTQALPIHDFSELAQALELHSDDLGWLTAPAYLGYSHYHCFWQKKQSGSERRLIESPKPLLKLTQNIIREKILEPVPLHEAANGFVRGKSIFDYVKPHVGRRMVLKLDLKDFFPGVTEARVIRLFLTMGYPEPVANLLTALTTHRTPTETLQAETLPPSVLNRFEKPHIPQGAPTSPTLANLCAFRLDCRLAGLARASGIRYTRYADDLLFSGGEPFRRNVRALYHSILTSVIEEGFQPHMQKTRFMPSGRKQHAAGLVLNEKPNISRVEYDRLKAILTNSLRYGPDSQNREKDPQFKEHLAGRIGWFRQSNPKRAERLDTLFEQIEWGP